MRLALALTAIGVIGVLCAIGLIAALRLAGIRITVEVREEVE